MKYKFGNICTSVSIFEFTRYFTLIGFKTASFVTLKYFNWFTHIWSEITNSRPIFPIFVLKKSIAEFKTRFMWIEFPLGMKWISNLTDLCIYAKKRQHSNESGNVNLKSAIKIRKDHQYHIFTNKYQMFKQTTLHLHYGHPLRHSMSRGNIFCMRFLIQVFILLWSTIFQINPRNIYDIASR